MFVVCRDNLLIWCFCFGALRKFEEYELIQEKVLRTHELHFTVLIGTYNFMDNNYYRISTLVLLHIEKERD